MNRERWVQLEELFNRALECDPGRRIQLLEEVGTTDPELRRELEALLSSHPAAKAHLHAAVRDEAQAIDARSERTTLELNDTAVSETRIGPYHLLQLIGQGGMGEVWLAEQKAPVRRRVAVKLVKAGMDTREVVARFESERQALALMDHPAIAKVFDAGSTAYGRPYFVMEYVPGIPITEYCDNHKLTINQRLNLFILVCEGVQHAHQKAIIHRDLKPSNVLVAEVDGKPSPRIIDFGVAKATSQKLTADTLYTRVGAVIGTIDYMSPEQANSAGEDIDTRTDVYSLGVLLYQLLTGTLPFDFQKIRHDEALRRLREQDPPKPSTTLQASGPNSTAIAQNRSTDSHTLTRQLQGDADAIVLKALERDRARRYATPLELSAEIARYLRHEPVTAHAPGVSYRARKYVRRHRLGVAVAAAFFVLLVAAAVVQTVELRRIARERDRADTEAATARAVNDFLQYDLLGQANPRMQARLGTSVDPDIKVRTALDRAADLVRARFFNKPLIEAAIQATIGNAYVQIGLYTQGREHLERALELRRRVLGDDNPATLASMFDVAFTLYRFEHIYAGAEPLFKKVLELRQRRYGNYSPATLDAMARLGDLYRYQGKLAQAEQLLATATARFRQLGMVYDFRALAASNDLALVYEDQRRYADAEPLFERVLQGFRVQAGDEHPETLNIMNNLGVLLRHERKYAQAEALLTKALDVKRRVLREQHPETQRAMMDLIVVYADESRYSDAEPLLIRLVDLRKQQLGADHRETLSAIDGLAHLYQREGKYAIADHLLTQALEVRRRTGSPATRELLALGDLRVERKQYAQAEMFLREALNKYAARHSAGWNASRCEALLGASLAGQKKYVAAEPLLLEGYQGMLLRKDQVEPSEWYQLDRARESIVRLYTAWGKPAQAAQWKRPAA